MRAVLRMQWVLVFWTAFGITMCLLYLYRQCFKPDLSLVHWWTTNQQVRKKYSGRTELFSCFLTHRLWVYLERRVWCHGCRIFKIYLACLSVLHMHTPLVSNMRSTLLNIHWEELNNEVTSTDLVPPCGIKFPAFTPQSQITTQSTPQCSNTKYTHI